jgi:HSP20 family protein
MIRVPGVVYLRVRHPDHEKPTARQLLSALAVCSGAASEGAGRLLRERERSTGSEVSFFLARMEYTTSVACSLLVRTEVTWMTESWYSLEVNAVLLATFDPFAQRAFGDHADFRRLARMDAVRRENEVELRFDLPGIDRESIDVTVDRGVLTVSATRNEEHTEGEKPFIRERVMGSYTRRVRLSDTVDAEKIEANYTDGVLTVHVPVSEQAKPRKIEVSADAKAIAA